MKLFRWIFHPFLFALYPVLYLLVYNITEVVVYSAIRSLVISLLLAGVFLAAMRLLLPSWQRAALAASILVILFFTYGHVYSLIEKKMIFGFMIGRHRYLLVLWLLIAGMGLWWAARRVKNPINVGQILNLVAVTLLSLVLLQYLNSQVQVVNAANQKTRNRLRDLGIATLTNQLNPPGYSDLPDVYYIILDGYSRADVLKFEYGFDNQAFIDELEKRGFYVAQCSKSNYTRTALSLASSLDMEYIPPLGKKLLTPNQRWQSFGVYMVDNVVRRTLEELGYKTVAFDTAHTWASVTDADYYYLYGTSPLMMYITLKEPSSFEQMLLDTTALLPDWRRIEASLNRLLSDEEYVSGNEQGNSGLVQDSVPIVKRDEGRGFYKLNRYVMKSFADATELPTPKFVFAHLMSTHTPYVMGVDGSFQYDPTDAGYLDAIQYANNTILTILDKILSKAGPKPIIIIQGDHGKPTSNFETSILNAYYLPDGGNQYLYPTITPVNSFRLVFTHYFGANLPLMDDVSYALGSNARKVFQFTPISDPGPGCQ